MSISIEEINAVKARGFLRNRGTDCFSGRVVTTAGIYTPSELSAIAECAERFGSGRVVFTSRLSAEIVGIPYDRIPEAEAFLASHGMQFGGTGAKVRPITACKGTTCVFGNIDTHALASEIHERFYVGMKSVKLPHKFKIGVGGCPNSCMKQSLNDVGIEGCKPLSYDPDVCRGCKKCAVAEKCPSHAVEFTDGRARVDMDKCKNCGVCVGKCPFGAFAKQSDSYCRIFVGGTWGKTQRNGTPLSRLYTPSEVCDVIEKVMLWYKENGYAKERLGAAIDRLGIDALERAIDGADILNRRSEILALDIKSKV